MSEVRVRIAPSPTGAPHVGTAYIAIFNWVYARKHQGKFILRIEDTDQNRSHPKYEQAVMEALRWVGLNWDEGPDVGGQHGPYRQSERTEIYRKFAEELIAKEQAFRCFCTAQRLETMRKEQMQRKENPRYDGKCRHLSQEEIQQNLSENVPYTVRLKVPDEGHTTVPDYFRGEINYEHKEIDDQVLLKSDGFPTYHLANVVDDHLMKVSHVIRGEEWLTSTPKHILLYQAFGWQPPQFIHMPLLLNPDGSKLSKRKNPTSIFYYKDAGYLPEALANYLCLMGYSRPNGEEKFSLTEMVSDFNINRVSLGGSAFDLQKLSWLSGKYIREDLTPGEILERLKNWRLNDEYLAKIVPLLHQRMDTLGDFMPLAFFFWASDVKINSEELVPKKKTPEETVQVLQSMLLAFEEDQQAEWNHDYIHQTLKFVGEVFEWKIREVTAPLFVAISGMRVAPPLFESMEYLGKDMVRVRITRAIQALGGVSKKKLKKIESHWNKRSKEIREQMSTQ